MKSKREQGGKTRKDAAVNLDWDLGFYSEIIRDGEMIPSDFSFKSITQTAPLRRDCEAGLLRVFVFLSLFLFPKLQK